jgi:small nuclear ribonucleoprotein E
VFDLLRAQKPVEVWLFEQTQMRIQGVLVGFDDFMNLVLDRAVEVDTRTGARVEIGRIMLKGDNVTLLRAVDV